MGTNTHTDRHRQTHCHMAIIHFHSYKVHSVHRMFTACSLFWSCSTQHQLWCLTKEFPLVSCLYEWVCVCACACAARREVIDSLLHIQPISGLRSCRPCRQPVASFPLSFTPSLSPSLLPPLFHISLAALAGSGHQASMLFLYKAKCLHRTSFWKDVKYRKFALIVPLRALYE